MREPKFKKISPNYNKRVLDIILVSGRKKRRFFLPFSVFTEHNISKENPFVSIEIDRELRSQGVVFKLKDGSTGDFPSGFVLYYCDPSYEWSPLNQIKRELKEKVGESRLSVRVMADALNTSPSQVVRLFKENADSKKLLQLFHLAELAGYRVEFSLKRKTA